MCRTFKKRKCGKMKCQAAPPSNDKDPIVTIYQNYRVFFANDKKIEIA